MKKPFLFLRVLVAVSALFGMALLTGCHGSDEAEKAPDTTKPAAPATTDANAPAGGGGGAPAKAPMDPSK